MASSVSLLNNYNGSLFTFANKDLLMQGLMMKQGTYDLNKSRLEQLRNQVGFLDVAKNSDQEYLNRRLTEAEDVIKSSVQNGDLSNTYLVDQLTAKIEEVVDEPILNAVVSTATRKREEAQWKEAMEANDGSYSNINHSVMSRNWNKYISDDRVGIKYSGGGGFTPFVDIDKIYASKEFNDYLKNSGLNTEYIVSSDGVGGFQAIDKYEGTADPDRLKQAIESYMGERGKKQLQINSIYKYGYGDTPESVETLRNDYNSRINSYLDNAESRLEAVNTELNSNISNERREYLNSQKSELEQRIDDNQSLSFDKDVVGSDGFIDESKFTQIANGVYSSNKMDQLFNLTYMKPVWKDRNLDAVQSKAIEFQEQQRQFELNYGLRAQQLDISRGNLELGMAKAGFTRDENGNLIPVTSQGEGGNQLNVQLGAGVPVTEEEAPSFNILSDAAKDLRVAIDGIYKSVGGDWTESSTAELQKQLAVGDGFAIGDEFKLSSGRKIKVTPENIGYIQTLEDVSKGQNSTVAKISNGLERVVLGLGGEGDIGNAGAVNWRDIFENYNNMQPSNIMMVKNSDGTYNARAGKLSGAKSNNLQYLAWKIENKGWEKLTDNERMTANYYKVKIIQNNKDFNDDEKLLINKSLYRSMGGNVKSLKDAELEAGEVDNSKVRSLMSTALDDRSPISSLYQFARVRGAGSDVISSNKLESPLLNNDLVNRDNLKVYELYKDEVANATRSIIDRTKIVVTPPIHSSGKLKDAEKLQYEAIKNIVDLPTDYKGAITFSRIIKNGRPTSDFKIEIDNTTGTPSEGKEYGKKELSTTISESKIRNVGIQTYVPEETPYNTRLGNFSATTSILPSSNFKSKTVGNVTIPSGTPSYYSNEIRQGLDSWQDQIRIISGNPSFNIYQTIQSDPLLVNPKVTIQPVDGSYYTVFGDPVKGGIVFGTPLGESIEKDVISRSKVVGDDIILAGFKEYLSKKLNLNF